MNETPSILSCHCYRKKYFKICKLLHTSQPSVSRIIQEAENEIGTPLLSKHQEWYVDAPLQGKDYTSMLVM